jgi:putative spermidine/putrescine transport system substrate-binding protein
MPSRDGLTMARSPSGKAAGRASRPRLRVLGTEITLIEPLRQKAESDLDIDIVFEKLDFIDAQRKAATDPGSFDVYDQCFHNLDIVWFWRAIQPLALDRITHWNEVSSLTKTGRLGPMASPGRGDAPARKLYVQPDLSLSSKPSDRISMLPTVHNLDSFAYIADLFPGRRPEEASWAWLFDPEARGGLALVDEPAIGIFDAALAFEARGDMAFADLGNMTIAEIDTLMRLLWSRRKEGYFAGLWRTAAKAAQSMIAGDTRIGSMWSPGTIAVLRAGRPIEETVPREGYRAWHSGLCLSARLSGDLLDTAYRYLNWWLEGAASATMARQGFYMSVPERARAHMEPAEWAYWYEGKPAATDLPGPDGRRMIEAGAVRVGGSYWERASHISVWNTTMDEYNYLARHWAQFAASFAA